MNTKPKSAPRGRSTSLVEVTNISAKGLWLLLDDQEHFLPYKQFPWFRDARVSEILEVTRPSARHLYWPELDIDLAVESILHPERYPLVSGVRSGKARAPVASKRELPRRSPRD